MSIKGFSIGGVTQKYDYNALDNIPEVEGLSEEAKQALLQLAQKVAYIDDQGQTYYDDLYDALYPPRSLDSIDAVFNQGSTVIYDTASLNSLKQYLTVTANYSDGTREMLSDSAYTLTGTLTVGTSTVTASYQGKTDTFAVTVTEAPVLDSITAIYTQSGTVYDDDTLDSLKADLVVTAHYSDSSTQTVPAADYTLSGTLTVGTSIITVSYGGKTTTFNVTVTHAVTMFSVTNNLTNITSSNSATRIAEGEQYAATLTADEGYAIASVTVTMGGVDVTSTAYSNGVITIASVNGDISITATAVGSIDVQSLLLAHGYYYDGYASTLGGGASWTHYGTSVDGGTTPAYAIQLEQGKTYTVSTVHNKNSGTYLPVAFAGATDGSVGPSGGSGMPGRNNIAKISTIQSTMTSEQIASGVYKLTWTFTCGRTTAYMSVGCLKNYKSYASVTFTD